MIDFLLNLYHLFLYQPIFNVLIFLSQVIPGKDFGVAVILLTLGVRFLSYPLGAQAIQAQKKLTELQPKIKETQERYKHKREEQAKAILQLYKTANLNPFAAFLPILVQIPIFIVLYQIFSQGIPSEQFSILYPFIPRPEAIDARFLGLIDLNEPAVPLALLAGVAQFFQLRQTNALKTSKIKSKKPDLASFMQTNTMYIFPVAIVWIASSLPSAFALYWICSMAFSLWQYWFITQHKSYVA